MADFRGIACQWGISTTAFANSQTLGTGVAVKVSGEEFEKSVKQEELLERNGEPVGLGFYDRRKVLSLNLWPSAATIAAADGAILVTPGDVLTLTDALDTDVGSTFSGKYIVRRASKTKRNDGKVVWSVTVEQFSTDLASGSLIVA